MHGLTPRAGLLAVVALLLFAVAPLSADASLAAIPSGTRSADETPGPTSTGPTPRSSPRPSIAERPAAGVPTASIGPFDCERLTVDLALDNSRSTQGVTFRYTASYQSPLFPPYRGKDGPTGVDVAAGESTVVVLRVRDDARTLVTVRLPGSEHVFSQGTCGDAPGAVFARSDCEASRLGLHLDNTNSRATRYLWVERDAAGLVATGSDEVAARAVADIDVPLVDGARVRIDVTVGDTTLVATSEWRACGQFLLSPRASFGVVDCADVSAPVILDNSRTTARLRFHLPAHPDVVLGAGETRALRLHLPIAERLRVYADEVPADGSPIDLAVVSTARCAAATSDPNTVPAPIGDATDADPAASGSAPLVPIIGVAALILAVALVLSGGFGTRRPLRRSR